MRPPSVVMICFALIPLQTLAQKTEKATGNQRTVSVRGYGYVTITPDQVRTTMQVAARGESAAAAMGETSTRTSTILALLKSMGVDDKDVQTSSVTVTPIYDQGQRVQPPPIVGYTGSNSFSILFEGKLMDNVGTFLDKAVTAGASSLGALRFESSQRRLLEREALRKAASDARARAEVLAKELGGMLGQAQSVSETVFGSTRKTRESQDFEMADQSVAAPVMAGELKISAQVDVVFELK